METRNQGETKPNKGGLIKNIALLLLGLIAVGALIFGYVQHQEKNEYVAVAIEEKKANEQYVLDAFSRIETNLEKIRSHEGMIRESIDLKEKEGNLSLEDRIQFEIQALEQLMNENQRIISDLNEQLDSKNTMLASYERSVKDLKNRIEDYKQVVVELAAERDTLKQNLAVAEEVRGSLEQTVVTLSDEIEQKAATIEEKEQTILERETALNTAYYTIGSFKDLRDRQIVEKEGGIFGIAAVKTLSDDADPGQFNEIDRREVTRIPVLAKRAEIITNQDTSSYVFEYNDDKIEYIRITDPEKFWKNSKYLVVVVRDSEYSELADAR